MAKSATAKAAATVEAGAVGTGVGLKPKISPEAGVRTAVAVWATAEKEAEKITGGAIWKVIRACWMARTNGETEGAIKTFLVSSVEDSFGKDASRADQRGAHISKIKKIAMTATGADFDRWEKAGTGFYAAYNEFAKPQQEPAKAKGAKPDVAVVPRELPAGYVNPALGTEAKMEQQNTELADPDAMAKQVQDLKQPSKLAVQAAEAKKAREEEDHTAAWATTIGKRKNLWTNLVTQLIEHKDLSADMIFEVFQILAPLSSVKLRAVVEKLMQDEEFSGLFIDFYKQNPQMYEDEPIDPGVEEEDEAGVEA